MATFNATTVVLAAARPQPRAQLRAASADTLRCAYSKESLKTCSEMNLSPAVLRGLGLRRVSKPWGTVLIEERMGAENSSLRRLSRALNPEWVLACVLGYIFFNPRRLQRRYNDDRKSGGLTL